MRTSNRSGRPWSVMPSHRPPMSNDVWGITGISGDAGGGSSNSLQDRENVDIKMQRAKGRQLVTDFPSPERASDCGIDFLSLQPSFRHRKNPRSNYPESTKTFRRWVGFFFRYSAATRPLGMDRNDRVLPLGIQIVVELAGAVRKQSARGQKSVKPAEGDGHLWKHGFWCVRSTQKCFTPTTNVDSPFPR